MKYLIIIGAALLVLVLLKIVIKTIKTFFYLALIGALVLAWWLFEQGLLFQ